MTRSSSLRYLMKQTGSLLFVLAVVVWGQAHQDDYPDYQDYANDDYGSQDNLYYDYAARQEEKSIGTGGGGAGYVSCFSLFLAASSFWDLLLFETFKCILSSLVNVLSYPARQLVRHSMEPNVESEDTMAGALRDIIALGLITHPLHWHTETLQILYWHSSASFESDC